MLIKKIEENINFLEKKTSDTEDYVFGAPYTCACSTGFKVDVVDANLCIPIKHVSTPLRKIILYSFVLYSKIKFDYFLEPSSRIPFIYFALLITVAIVLIIVNFFIILKK